MPIKSLEGIAEALIKLIKPLPNKRIYKEDENGNLIAWYINKIEFTPGRRDYPATTTMSMINIKRGTHSSNTVTIYRETLNRGLTAESLLIDTLNYILETEELNDLYVQEIKLYHEYREQMGKQFLGSENAPTINSSDWKIYTVYLGAAASKVIIDDEENNEDRRPKKKNTSSIAYSNDFWMKKMIDDDEENLEVIILPINPRICCFDLRTHNFVSVHVNQLKPYVYNPLIAEKLILSENKKSMIETLVDAVDIEGEDIIKGKSGGIIIMSSGKPGTGKTLTAEIFSEFASKPLYVVQCSQLGTEAEGLEKKLSEVLERATRWKAILLIDESDVYIH